MWSGCGNADDPPIQAFVEAAGQCVVVPQESEVASVAATHAHYLSQRGLRTLRIKTHVRHERAVHRDEWSFSESERAAGKYIPHRMFMTAAGSKPGLFDESDRAIPLKSRGRPLTPRVGVSPP
jgi:hypothetical protein